MIEKDIKKALLRALINLAEQADEDTPLEYRSEHFKEALTDAVYLINKMGIKAKGIK